MIRRFSITQFRARLSELIRNVLLDEDRIIVTLRGKPAAALVSLDDYDRLQSADRRTQPDSSRSHPIMAAYGGWSDRDDLDSLSEEIYLDRSLNLGREERRHN